MSLRHWLQLSLTEGIGPVLQTRLIEACGGVEAACEANGSKLRTIEGIGAGKSQKISDALKESAKQVDDEIAKAHGLGVSLICRDDRSILRCSNTFLIRPRFYMSKVPSNRVI